MVIIAVARAGTDCTRARFVHDQLLAAALGALPRRSVAAAGQDAPSGHAP
jgi:hypothetical protein